MTPSRTVHLIDASPYIFRAYFSLPASMVDRDGNPVGAVYGFLGFLLKLIDDEAPSHLGVAFDESLTTSFRNDIYPDYKAQRDLPPATLERQLADSRRVAAALGAATFSDRRYEADDLIGTLSRQLVAAGHSVVVVTSDKDLAQLVGERVELFDFAAGKRYGASEVKAKFAVRPGQLADLLALAGDSVDNIPGVAGIGRKTAAALLSRFGDLDAIYRGLEEVPDLPLRGARAIAAKLEAGREQALLSRRLATIATDAPVEAALERLELRGARHTEVGPLFDRLGFGTRDRIRRWAEPPPD